MTDSQPLSAPAVQILVTLARGPLHGYGIKLDVEERTGSQMVMGSGTLYQAIQRLLRREYLTVAETDSEDPRRGRVYAITDEGRAALRSELARMEALVEYARANPRLIDSDASA